METMIQVRAVYSAAPTRAHTAWNFLSERGSSSKWSSPYGRDRVLVDDLLLAVRVHDHNMAVGGGNAPLNLEAVDNDHGYRLTDRKSVV